ncbi:hypothetical protein [Streptomyces sp. NPDC054952]
MKQLGKHLHESGCDGAAEKWLLIAVQSGDAEVMDVLWRVHRDRAVNATRHGTAHDATAAVWCRRAAEAGWVAAIRSVSSWAEPDEREFCLRKAVETVGPYAGTSLADLLDEEGRTAEAEQWYRGSCRESGLIGRHARNDLAHLLMRQGRLEEASGYWTTDVEAGSSVAAGLPAGVLERPGRPEEAGLWRRRVDVLRVRERARELPER